MKDNKGKKVFMVFIIIGLTTDFCLFLCKMIPVQFIKNRKKEDKFIPQKSMFSNMRFHG